MPIPKPRKGEKKDEFISRCMGDATMNKDFPDNGQRYAICSQQLGKKEDEETIETTKEQTYNDYPEAATNNAKRALKWKEEKGSSCGTPVGWTRARQLANREALSRDTIARMASFKRHQQNKDVPYSEGCGGIMWDCWGGDAGIEWAIRKLEQIDKKALEDAVDSLIKKMKG